MGNAAFRHPREHVADLLPAFLNGTLDGEDRTVVQRHLASCEACMASLAAWRAVAAATARGVARLEAEIVVRGDAAQPRAAARPTQPHSIRQEIEPMTQASLSAVPAGLPTRLPNRRALTRAMEPLSRIAAVVAITLSVGVGILAYLNSGPESGSHALAPATQSGECTVQPLTDAQLAAAVYLPGTLDGTNRAQASYIDPAVTANSASALPADGAAVDQATANAISSLWNTYQACLASDPQGVLPLMSQDGLRRIYYRYVYNNISADFMERTASEPKVIAADATRQAALSTPEATKPAPATIDANIGQYQPSVPSGFVIRDLKTMADGRVIAGLDDPNCSVCRSEEYEGLAVFVKVDGDWKIDDATVFHG